MSSYAITTYQELFNLLNYSKITILTNDDLKTNPIYENQIKLFSLFISPVVPLVLVLLYWFISKPLFSSIQKTFHIQPKGRILQLITIIHSIVLAVYSMYTFYHSSKILMRYMENHSLLDAFNDVDGKLWNNYQIG